MQALESTPVPSPTATGQHRRRTDVATSLPSWRAQPGSRARDGNRGRDRVCLHWPLEGAARIHSNACALAALAQRWDAAVQSAGAWPLMPPHCIDVHTPASPTATAHMQQCALALSGELDGIQQCARAIARDYQAAADWLDRGAGSASNSPAPVRRGPGLASSLGEDHRVVTRDRLAADMNAMVAWLLRQALKVLDRIDLQTSEVQADLVGSGSHRHVLLTAARMLDRASVLARESELFVEAFDLRWRDFRDHISATVASSKALSAPAPGLYIAPTAVASPISQSPPARRSAV